MLPGRGLRIGTAALAGLACGACERRPAAAPELRRGGELRLVEEPGAVGWDPLEADDIVSQNLVSQVYEALVEYAPEPPYAPVPALARAWSAAGDRWTFRLRAEARFADDACFPDGRGRRVLAADVRYAIERELRARPRRQFMSHVWDLSGARDVYEDRAESIVGLAAPDDSTVVFRLAAPCAAFVHAVAGFAVVAREAVEAYGGEFWQHPVGTGPFRLARWTPQEAVVLVRNPDYWGRDARGDALPYLDRVVLYLVPPRTLPAARDLHVQKLDLAAGTHGASERVLGVTRFNVIYFTWDFAQDSPWTRDVRLRQALSAAIQRPATPSQVPARGLLPPGLAGHDSLLPPLGPHPQRAARLLEAAGYAGGRGLPPLRLHSILEEATMVRRILEPLADLGIEWQVVNVTKAQFWDFVPSELPAFFRWGWIADYPDAENFFDLFYGGSAQNLSRFRDAVYDSLFAAALATTDAAARARLGQRMQRRLLETMPALFLHHDRNTLLVRDDVRDFDLCVNPLWRKQYKHVWLDTAP